MEGEELLEEVVEDVVEEASSASFQEIMTKYALPVICMALIVMVLVGFIKIFTKMIPSKAENESKVSKVMSYLYVVFTLLLTVGVVFAYRAIFKLEFAWLEMVKEGASVFACTQALYPIYRDYGGRFLLTKFLSLFKGKSAKADETIAVIEKIIVLTDEQKSTIENELKKL